VRDEAKLRKEVYCVHDLLQVDAVDQPVHVVRNVRVDAVLVLGHLGDTQEAQERQLGKEEGPWDDRDQVMPEAELQVVACENHWILDNFGVNDADRQEIEDHLAYLHGKYEQIDRFMVEELSFSRLLHAVTDQESRN
jgi:hypothetical protein